MHSSALLTTPAVSRVNARLHQHPQDTGRVVVAVNPYRWIEGLYSEERAAAYCAAATADSEQQLPPHVYATSSRAFRDMCSGGGNQSILVSGESGAGKTETTKILMRFLARASGGSDTATVDRVLQSNPLLEAFGNAKTVRNDNSSRFGKLTQLQFGGNGDAELSPALNGARTESFLLEKSRVVRICAAERNYHVFYQLLGAPAERRAAWHISSGAGAASPADFQYLCVRDGAPSEMTRIEGRSDAESFARTFEAMNTVGLSAEEQESVFRTAAGVLHIGNVTIEEDADDEAKSAIAAEAAAAVSSVCSLLGIAEDDIRRVFGQRRLCVAGEWFDVPLNAEQASDGRDALAKGVYQKLFDWLVWRINSAVAVDSSKQDTRSVAILDIFGFEAFEVNSFEQLCINFANEKLQQRFTADEFEAVQTEYASEGVPWERVAFCSNQNVLDLIEGRMGVVALLNEECMMPKGSDDGFVSKLMKAQQKHDCILPVRPRSGRRTAGSQSAFTIKHFAGDVQYEAAGMLDKNKDALQPELVEMLGGSSCDFVRTIAAGGSGVPSATNVGTESTGTEESKTGVNGRGRRKGGRAAAATVATKFKRQLGQLMDTISKTRTHYVRCIKPNTAKSAEDFDHALVVGQLRCAGVIEAVRISRQAFPNRMPHADALSRFRCVDPSLKDCDDVASLIARLGIEDGAHAGKTRVYFRFGVLEKLEARRSSMRDVAASTLQCFAMTVVRRARFVALKRATARIQTWTRMSLAIRRYRVIRAAVVRLQCAVRCLLAVRASSGLRRQRASVRIQSVFRRYRAILSYTRFRAAAVLVQSWLRMVDCRRQYVVQVAQAREDAKLENQVKSLQGRLDASEREKEQLRAELDAVRAELAATRAAASTTPKAGAKHLASTRASGTKKASSASRSQLRELDLNSPRLAAPGISPVASPIRSARKQSKASKSSAKKSRRARKLALDSVTDENSGTSTKSSKKSLSSSTVKLLKLCKQLKSDKTKLQEAHGATLTELSELRLLYRKEVAKHATLRQAVGIAESGSLVPYNEGDASPVMKGEENVACRDSPEQLPERFISEPEVEKVVVPDERETHLDDGLSSKFSPMRRKHVPASLRNRRHISLSAAAQRARKQASMHRRLRASLDKAAGRHVKSGLLATALPAGAWLGTTSSEANTGAATTDASSTAPKPDDPLFEEYRRVKRAPLERFRPVLDKKFGKLAEQEREVEAVEDASFEEFGTAVSSFFDTAAEGLAKLLG